MRRRRRVGLGSLGLGKLGLSKQGDTENGREKGRQTEAQRMRAIDGKLHEPRPFNFFGFDGAAAVELNAPLLPALMRRWRKAS